MRAADGVIGLDDAVELSDMIWQLRHELSRAMWAGEHTDLKFRAERVELELAVAVEKSSEPGMKVRFWVFDASRSTKRAESATQTIRLSLVPIQPAAPDRPAVIAGVELPGEK